MARAEFYYRGGQNMGVRARVILPDDLPDISKHCKKGEIIYVDSVGHYQKLSDNQFVSIGGDGTVETAETIKQKYESNADTNAYTDSDLVKTVNLPNDTVTELSNKASLVNGKIPASELPDSVTGGIQYQGSWDASTNDPTLSDGTGTSGYQYKVSVAGTVDLGSGSVSYDEGDILLHNGSIWEKFDQTETVSSVAGKTGIVTLDKDDVSLENVDNTSDANKPISTLQQAGLNLKEASLGNPSSNGQILSSTVAGVRSWISTDTTRSPVDIAYDDEASMLADQSSQSSGYLYYLTDTGTYYEKLSTSTASISDYRGDGEIEESISLHLSDYESSIETGTGKAYWLAPWDCTVQSAIGALLVTAPTGSSVVFDVNKNGSTMMTTNKIEVEATENTSITATTQPAFTTTSISRGDIISCDIDQVGSTEGGVAASVTITITR